MYSESFPPLLGPGPRVLVLGSMPGRRSLDEQCYYAHPRNLFWRLIGELSGVPAQRPYAERVEALRRAGIALWDVLASCERPGSLDASIVRGSERANPIGALLAAQPGIRAVACNGGAALQAYRRHVLPGLDPGLCARVDLIALPSTSPANASIPLAVKRQAWIALERYLQP